MIRKTVLVAVFLIVVFLSSCVTLKDPESSQEYTADQIATITKENPVGQSFISRRPGLDGIQLWLKIKDGEAVLHSNSVVTATLLLNPQDTTPLAIQRVTADEINANVPISFKWLPRSNPAGQRYFLKLESSGAEIQVFGRNEDAYPDGELFISGSSQPADAAFRTSYRYNYSSAVEDFNHLIAGIWLVIPLALVFIVPGKLLFELLAFERHNLDWGQRSAITIGFSLASIPLIMLWSSSLGMQWKSTYLWIFALILVLSLVFIFFHRFRLGENIFAHYDRFDFALMAIFIFSLIIRLIMVRDLAGPAWVDSVHHALITRLITEQGKIPESYFPFIQHNDASYHPGYHIVLAAFQVFSQLEIPQAMLFFGQMLNAFTVLAVYLLTVIFTKDRQAGLFAALFTGVFSAMPAYYTGWGRYTQLAGLLIMPVAFYFIKREFNAPLHLNIQFLKKILAASILCAGLFLVHYRVSIFLAILILAWLVAESVRSLDKQAIWQTLPKLILPVFIIFCFSISLTLPWWLRQFSSIVTPALQSGAASPQVLQVNWGYLTPASGRLVLVLAALGLALSIARAHWLGPTLALWVALLFLSANPGNLHLPVSGAINNSSVEIMLFLPLSILAGYFISQAIHLISRFFSGSGSIVFRIILTLAVITSAIWAARKLLPILNPTTIILRRADLPALSWASQYLPKDTKIMINPFEWGYGLYAGQDGGYWLSPQSGRISIPPPVLYGYGNSSDIVSLDRQVVEKAKQPDAIIELMNSHGIEYIFLGARGGILSPKAFAESGRFKTLYSNDGVWIFKIAE